MPEPIIRFGSLTARLHADKERSEDVARIFGTSLTAPTPALLAQVDLDIVLRASADDGVLHPPLPPVREDGMVLRHGASHAEIYTDTVSAILELGATPARADIAVLRPDAPHFDVCVHLAVVLHKILFFLNRVVLHAAAVRFAGRVHVFLGDRGAGKSTIALKLTRAGGTVIGEDHLILQRSVAGFLVSGCDDRWRLDAKTEGFFFDQPLPAEPVDFAGRLKKEVRAQDGLPSQPYTDERADLLFFARPSTRFRIARLSRGAALLKLMEAVGKLQRFVNPTDRSRFLNVLSDFVQTVTPYELELSDDLRELDGLVRFLAGERPLVERV